jgi:outer membrane protein assembly factor BamB
MKVVVAAVVAGVVGGAFLVANLPAQVGAGATSAKAGAAAATPSAGGASAKLEWAQWRGPNRDGIINYKIPLPLPSAGPKVLWKAAVGQGYSCVVSAGGKAVTLGNAGGSDTIYCFNEKDGAELWKQSYKCGSGEYAGPRATPCIDGDKVYSVGREGQVLCLAMKDGAIVWNKDLKAELKLKIPGWGISGSPVVDGKALYVNVGLNGAALNKDTGAVVWKSDGDQPGYASPVLFKNGPGTMLAVFAAKGLVGLNPATGAKAWSFPWPTSWDVNAADPVVMGNRVFITSGYGTGCAMVELSAAAPKEVWRNKNLASHFSTPVCYQDYIYGVSGDANGGCAVKCLDPKTGEVKWSHDVGGGMGSLLIATDKLVILSGDGNVTIAEAAPEAFKPVGEIKGVVGSKCWTMPTLSNGKLYCRNDGGAVVCLDLESK